MMPKKRESHKKIQIT